MLQTCAAAMQRLRSNAQCISGLQSVLHQSETGADVPGARSKGGNSRGARYKKLLENITVSLDNVLEGVFKISGA
jgi:propanediol dehydratase small subunit